MKKLMTPKKKLTKDELVTYMQTGRKPRKAPMRPKKKK